MITRVKGSSINMASLVNMVSLLDLGPQGSDITALMQQAMNEGYGIIIPWGQWRHHGLTYPDNAVVVGFGSQSILKLTDAANVVQCTVGSNCFLKDFVLDGNKDNQTGSALHALSIVNSLRSKIYNVLSINSKGCGYFVSNSNELDLVKPGVAGYVEAGIKVAGAVNCHIDSPSIYSSDVAATGDGIAFISDGNQINGVELTSPKLVNLVNRGISLIGSGTRNVINVDITAPRIMGVSSHGIHMLNADAVTVSGGQIKNNGGDGIRLEGDVQHSRVITVQINNNTGFGVREVANGATPNNNGLIYNSLQSNASNVQTKLGVASFVV